MSFHDEATLANDEWYYEDGLKDYLSGALQGWEVLPGDPFTGTFSAENEAVDWAVQWLPEGGELVQESYVNLIPTPQGGTHVNGMRTGLLEAMREFCEFRNLLPRGIKLTPTIYGIAVVLCSHPNLQIHSFQVEPKIGSPREVAGLCVWCG